MTISPGYRAPAVVRAFALLEEVARAGEPVGISRLAENLNLGKSTVHGLVKALLEANALERIPGTKRLRLGTLIHDLAVDSVNWPRLTTRLQPELEKICRKLGQTVCLGVMGTRSNLILAAAEPENTIKISAPPGTRLPLLAGALGKLLLSGLDEENARAMIRQHGIAGPGNSSADLECYLQELENVRRKGYAVDRQEYLPGVVAVAVALEAGLVPALALWCVGLAAVFSDEQLEEIGEFLFSRKTELSARLA